MMRDETGNSVGLPVLVLFRHGQTDYNATRRFQGQENIPLNDTGRKQATQTAEIVANILSSFLRQGSTLERFISSDLVRASETAQTVSSCLNERLKCDIAIETMQDLREYDCGDLANYTVDEFSAKFPGVIEKYFVEYETNKFTAKFPGEKGESREMVLKRLAPHLLRLNQLTAENRFPNSRSVADLEPARAHFHVWSTHGGIIDALLEMTNNVLTLETKPAGNGDVLVLYPVCRYENSGIVGNSEGTVKPSGVVRDLDV